MNLNYAASNKMPEAFVAINKSRIKSYDNIRPETLVSYLSDKTEFQLELFNPTQETILAKIKIDNKNISQGGLILKPGERIFLERYLDIPNKFLFETYEVEGDNSQVQEAIKNNGGILVEFFKEQYINSNFNHLPWKNNGFNPIAPYYQPYNTNDYYYNNTTNFNVSDNYNLTSNLNASVGFSNQSNDLNSRRLVKSKKTIETGKIEVGGSSNQNFKSVDKEFSFFSFHKVNLRILPLSHKISDTSEVVKVAKYCTSCGYKVHYKDKYCGQCGNKL
jgi:hypothetical protein